MSRNPWTTRFPWNQGNCLSKGLVVAAVPLAEAPELAIHPIAVAGPHSPPGLAIPFGVIGLLGAIVLHLQQAGRAAAWNDASGGCGAGGDGGAGLILRVVVVVVVVLVSFPVASRAVVLTVIIVLLLAPAAVVVAHAGCLALDHPLRGHEGEGQLPPDVAMAFDLCLGRV